MKVDWWGPAVIGAVLAALGGYTASVSQDAVGYIRSCGSIVAVCSARGNPRPTLFLTPSLTDSLQHAQLLLLVGIAILGGGLALLVYGIYLHPSVRGQVAQESNA